MNWEDERYVRLYVRDTITWKLLGWQGRCLLPLLLRKVDRAGCVELDGAGEEGIAALVDIPLEVVTPGLAKLIERSVVEIRGDILVFPKYVAAHEARQSDKLRAQESRARRREQVMEREPVTNRDSCVTNRDVLSRAVTPRHTASLLEEKRREEKSGDKDLAGGSSPARHVEATGQTSEPESPRTPAPVQGSRPAQQQVALLPDEPKRTAPARQTRASKSESLIAATWQAFSAAHQHRHGVAPVWAGKMAGIFKRIVGEVGAEAPAVAAYYLTHNGSFYVSCGHSAAILERDIQKLRREMLTGNQVNAAAARHQEQRAATVDKWDQRIREREREEREGAIDVECESA